MDETSQLESPRIGIMTTLSRIEAWSILIQVAVISMYLLFAGSFYLSLSDVRSRLTVYLTIAAFSLSFIIYLQPNLPWRPFYTLPEFLIITLMGVVAFAGLFSMMGAGFGLIGFAEVLPDLATLFSSFVFWYYLFLIFTQAHLTSAAKNLLNLAYAAFFGIGLLAIIFRMVKYWKRERRGKEEKIKPIPYEF